MSVLSPALCQTLRKVAEVMREAHDDWWIITSAAVALHGADPGKVRDVDLLTSTGDATRLLRRLAILAERPDETIPFRSSIFARWIAPPLPVEIMADFHHHNGITWVPILPRTRQPIVFGADTVFVPSVAEVAAMARQFGRPKDLKRAQALEARYMP